MKVCLTLIVLNLLISVVAAQTTETIQVSAGEDISKIISDNGIYRLSSFTSATYLLNNGISSTAKMNYNLFTEEMQYLNMKGDTMAVANSNEINYIHLGNVVFYYRDGYKEIFADHDSIKLASALKIKLEYKKLGVHDQPTEGWDVSSMNDYISTNNVYLLRPAQAGVIKKTVTYYILNKNELPMIATKKNFLKIFAANRDIIRKYLEENEINFNEKESLKKLLAYCLSL